MADNNADRPDTPGLENAATVDEQRRGTGDALYQVLLAGLDPDEQERVVETVRCHAEQLAEADRAGQSPPRPIW